ncbi:uncharacterized protein PGTG_20659 [Puccinia graminis f. sp. tritici CRL 75-36-700-3]|uniref:Uncharacterized protein n=1 Tax=Puccinia graminis f. sp. tritici (strain CRL 75-36-700-3 / race SCCL) TaxID=418459 RepID=H6QPE1_PUCGT|nr:uncharacterized protein PGTG_20659 [Puccinia graminis f. sp. tritici CRL 75-36-700-3]EHS63562.1 hypothetical protein PGTG_20659 [Puccinia graminis f. sp. tritici CRL 75-36-700-3]
MGKSIQKCPEITRYTESAMPTFRVGWQAAPSEARFARCMARWGPPSPQERGDYVKLGTTLGATLCFVA